MKNYILVLFLASIIYAQVEDLDEIVKKEEMKKKLKEGKDQQEELKKKKEELKQQLEDTLKQKEKLKEQLEKVNSQKDEIKETLKEKQKAKDQLKETLEKRDNLKNELDNALNSNVDIQEKLKNMPELDKLTKQLDMMKNLGCFMLVQKKLKAVENEIKTISKSNPNKNGIKKVISEYYKTCQEKIPTEDQMKIFGQDQANFKQLDDIPIFDFLKDQSLKLSDEDEKFFKSYTDMEDQMQKIRKEMDPKKEKKSTKKTKFKSAFDNKKKSEKKDKKKDKKKKRRGGVNFLGVYLNEINPLVFMGLFGLFLGVPFYFLWKMLFNNEVQLSKKDLKRLKKKKKL